MKEKFQSRKYHCQYQSSDYNMERTSYVT